MAKLRTPLFWDLLAVQERMNRLFDDLFVQGQEGSRSLGRWTPAVDIYETDSAIVLLAEVPGLEEKDLDIEISKNLLTLKGNRQTEPSQANETIHCIERARGPFKRTFSLPSEVMQEEVKASLKSGLLKVVLPKLKTDTRDVKIESD